MLERTVRVVDTSVLGAANDPLTGCHAEAAVLLVETRDSHIVAVDDVWLIINEYRRNADASGQPHPGDAFLKWLLTNRTNPARCLEVAVAPDGSGGFASFPSHEELEDFDLDDRVFICVALGAASAEVCVGVDTDYWEYEEPLSSAGVAIKFACPETIAAVATDKGIARRPPIA